jgi:PadR family transcriptional regulator, regulatory protein AphA
MNTTKTENSRKPAEYPVLGILALGEAHGYDICRRLSEEVGSIWRLGKSQVYALLMRLERDGLVVHERVGQENLPAKNIFSVTPMGEEVFKEWVRTPVHHVRDMRLEFLTKLWFAQQLGSESERNLIEAQLAVCQEKVTRLESMRGSCRTPIEYRSAEFRLAMIEVAISWLKRLLDNPLRTPGRSKETRSER